MTRLQVRLPGGFSRTIWLKRRGLTQECAFLEAKKIEVNI